MISRPVTSLAQSNAYSLLIGFFCFVSAANTVAGQTTEPKIAISAIGSGDVFRLGIWTSATLKVHGGAQGVQGKIQVIFLDGDGFANSFTSEQLAKVDIGPNEEAEFQLPVKIGREEGKARVELLDKDGKVLLKEVINVGDIATALSPTQQIHLFIGKSDELKNAIEAIDRPRAQHERPVLIKSESLAEFPADVRCAEGISLVFISSTDMESETFPQKNVASLKQWVNGGGTLVLSVGADAEKIIAENKPLASLLPGKFIATEELFESSDIETFAGSGFGEPLLNIDDEDDSYPVARIETSAEVIVAQSKIPLLVRMKMGFGQVFAVCLAIDQEPLASWEYNHRLIARVFENMLGKVDSERTAQSAGRVTHIGYSDTSGQLRASLDNFSKVSFVAFTLVAVLTVLYILAIGPGDFFLLKNVFKRMELTWLTFPLITAVFGAIAFAIYGQVKPTQMQANQVEIIDVDADTALARGKMWTHVYSPKSQKVDIQFPIDPKEIEFDHVLFSWTGFPGTALGAMSGNMPTQSFETAYAAVPYKKQSTVPPAIQQLPLQVGSTKAISASWSGSFQGEIKSKLLAKGKYLSNSSSITNPIDTRFSQAVLLYGEWAYLIRQGLDPGETVTVGEMADKELIGYLTRRKTIDGRDVTPSWDQMDLNVPRIIEMMMFYEAIGGEQYTKLSHGFHDGTDMTSLLLKSDDHAILIARVKENAHGLSINGKELDDEYDQKWTFYRILLPVIHETK